MNDLSSNPMVKSKLPVLNPQLFSAMVGYLEFGDTAWKQVRHPTETALTIDRPVDTRSMSHTLGAIYSSQLAYKPVRLWDVGGNGSTGGKPCRRKENVQSPHREHPSSGSNLGRWRTSTSHVIV